MYILSFSIDIYAPVQPIDQQRANGKQRPQRYTVSRCMSTLSIHLHLYLYRCIYTSTVSRSNYICGLTLTLTSIHPSRPIPTYLYMYIISISIDTYASVQPIGRWRANGKQRPQRYTENPCMSTLSIHLHLYLYRYIYACTVSRSNYICGLTLTLTSIHPSTPIPTYLYMYIISISIDIYAPVQPIGRRRANGKQPLQRDLQRRQEQRWVCRRRRYKKRYRGGKGRQLSPRRGRDWVAGAGRGRGRDGALGVGLGGGSSGDRRPARSGGRAGEGLRARFEPCWAVGSL